MTALSSVRRRWMAAALASALVLAMVGGLLVFVGIDTLRNSKEGRAANPLPPASTLPATPAAMLAVRGDDGSLAGVVVLALAPPVGKVPARGGTLIPVSVGAGIQNGEDPARLRLADYYARGGINGLADAASALLQLNFSLVSEVDRASLTALLGPLGKVRVDLANDVLTSEPASPGGETDASTTAPPTSASSTSAVPTSSGPGSSTSVDTPDVTDRVLFPAGRQVLTADDGAALLLASREGDPESVRFEQQVAYWTGVQRRVAAGLTAAGPSAAGIATMAGFMGALLRGAIHVYALRGEPISRGPENPDGIDVYRLNTAEVTRVMATVLPNAISPVEVTYTVQIVNPTGDSSLTQAAVERLAFQGIGVVLIRELTGIAVPDITEVSLGGKADLEDIKPFAAGLGETVEVPLGQAGTPHGRVQGIDVTFVLGRSFQDLIERQVTTTVPVAETSTSTTATTVAATQGSGG